MHEKKKTEFTEEKISTGGKKGATGGTEETENSNRNRKRNQRGTKITENKCNSRKMGPMLE